jgi:hypothetical protein
MPVGSRSFGTFEARCGKTDFGSSWPPDVVLTCHQGIAAPPRTWATAQVTVGQATAASMYATFPAPPTITSVSSEVHILPSSWTGPPLVPFDTTGWDATPQVQQDGTVYVDFWQLADPFGEEICPLVEEMPDPLDEPPPVFLARVSGDTDAGPFVSEIYTRGCMRVIMQ